MANIKPSGLTEIDTRSDNDIIIVEKSDGTVMKDTRVNFNGADGTDGLSAYEIAVAAGFSGTEAEWLTSLKGDNGDPGADGLDGDEISVGTAQTGNYTLQATDEKILIPFNSASEQVVTVPADTFLKDDQIALWRRGAGEVKIVGGTGVTIEGITDINGDMYINDQYTPVSLICDDTNSFLAYGNLRSGLPAPTVTSIDDNTIEPGETDTFVLTGTNFTAGTRVTCSGDAIVHYVTFNSSTSLSVNIEATAEASGSLTLFIDNGNTFTYQNAISIYGAGGGNFIVADMNVTSNIDNVAITQSGGEFAIADIDSTTNTDEITLEQEGSFVVAPLSSTSNIDNIALTQQSGEFAVSDMNVTSNIDNIALEPDSIIVFQDQFTGTTIDTTTKWNKTNNDPTYITFSQNDVLSVVVKNKASASAYGGNALTTKSAYPIAGLANCFDLSRDITSVQTYMYGLTKDSTSTSLNDIAVVMKSTNTSQVRCLALVGGSTVKDVNYTVDISTVKTFKVSYISGTLYWHYWNGSSWTLMTSHTVSLTGNFYGSIQYTAGPVATGDVTFTVDNFHIADADFSTRYPT